MKNRIFRLFTLAVCLIMMFTMFPVSADAAGNGYSTRSSTKVLLVFPKSGSLLSEPMHAKVTGDQKNGAIFYVPKPESGNGNLGTVKKGTNVTIFAEEDGYYFFMTNSGRMGWNKVGYFTEPEDYDTEYLPGNSGLTTDHLDEIKYFLRDNSRAGGSNKFYPSKPVIIVEKGETVKFTVYGEYRKSSTVNMSWYDSVHSLKWKTGNGKATVSIKGKTRDCGRITFLNYYTDREFQVLVIVV